MRRVLKWVLRGVAAVVVVALFAAWAAYFLLRNSVVSPSGRMELAGLAETATITRDRDGVPHITARTQEDIHFALGFAHAQDRLWQMELQRRTVAGRLSEVFGQSTLPTDIFMRTLDLYGHAARSVKSFRPEQLAQIEAYSRGVNAYITRRTALLEPRLPIEFMLLRHSPEPWTAADSIAIVKLMALNLSTNLGLETRRLAFAAVGLSPAEIEDLLPSDPAVAPPPLPDLASLYPLRKAPGKQAAAIPIVDEMIGSGASNNWVVAGSKTKSGKPLLANDPHLRISAPAIWYLAHLRLERAGKDTINAVGASLPGVPLIVIGRNDHIAWGFTNTGPDVQDIFIEKVNPDDRNTYLTPDGWRPFEIERLAIKVKGAADHTLERRRTRHGPVLPGGFRGLDAALAPNHVAALAWTALTDDDTTLAAGLFTDTLYTVDDYIALMKSYVVPMQSMVLADSKGNIAMIAPGRVPVRDPANLVAGRAPVPGWDATYDWKGWLDFSQLPQVKNPSAGAIGTANARIVPPDFPAFLTHDWDAPFRQQRVDALVTSKADHTVETMKAAQADVLSPAVERLQTLMIAIAQAAQGIDDKVLDQLTAWDGRQTVSSTESLIFVAWMREATRGIYADDLGPAFGRFFDARPQALIRLLEGKATSRDWCDDRRTPARESCAQVLAEGLSRALKDLEAQLGPDRSKWRWGDLHVAYNEHRPFGMFPTLAPYFNVEVPSPGGDETLNRGQSEWSEARPFANRHASSLRVIYDFADLERSLFIVPTGQSGNPMSRHYRDFAQRWSRVEYIEIPTTPEAVARIAAGTWTLTPQAKP